MKMAYITKEEEEFLYGLYQEVKIPEPYRDILFGLILTLEQRRKQSNDSAYYNQTYRKKTNNYNSRTTAK